MHRIIITASMILLLLGCNSRIVLAPVTVAHDSALDDDQKTYKVSEGDTLYAIAFRYDKDYRQLAVYNNLSNPYALQAGRIIYLQKRIVTRQAPSPSPSLSNAPPLIKHHPVIASNTWLWPAHGCIMHTFQPQHGQKGVDIVGTQKKLVVASRGGVVAYAGNGLAKYGNLIIIKHSDHYLTAYGNNARNLIKEGQVVAPGEIIAVMGKLNNKLSGVHFEIRKAGSPMNPLSYLQKTKILYCK